jgi:hypothetical protein
VSRHHGHGAGGQRECQEEFNHDLLHGRLRLGFIPRRVQLNTTEKSS